MKDQQTSTWRKVRSFFRGFQREYFDYLYYQHRFVNMKGITSQGAFNMEQPDVYVDVKLAPADPDELMAAVVTLSNKVYEDSQRIWNYLGKLDGPGNKLIVVGSPGSGKTTLLKQIVLAFCRSRTAYKLPARIPVLLFLRSHVADITRNPDVCLTDVLQESMLKSSLQFNKSWFEKKLKQGKCVILLDGLDEIGDSSYRGKMVKWVEKQFTAYPSNHFIITSRPHGISNIIIEGTEILQILPLEVSQIEKFIHDWYRATERKLSQADDEGVRMIASEGAQDLWRRIQNTESLHPLAQNPLLLTMITTLHRFDAQLPGRRVELYDAIFRIFFRRREVLGISLLTSEQSKSVLLPLAKFMMENRRREVSLDEAVLLIKKDLAEIGGEHIQPVEFLRGIQDQSGLLLEVAQNEFSFASLTFQEYLASVYYVETRDTEKLAGEINSDWWWETIRLYCAQANGTRIIEACLEQEPIQLNQLQLAISCLEEALRVEVDIRAKLNDIIHQSVDHPDPRWRNVIAIALLYKRLRFMERIDFRRLIDSSLVTNVEYQIFLDQEAEKGHYYYPDHWTEARFPLGKALEPVAGVRISDVMRFCEWLVPQDIWRYRYRIPEDGEIGYKCDTGGFQYWLSDGDSVKASGAKRDVSSRYKDIMIQQMIQDSEIFASIRSAAEREKNAKPTSELLETVLPLEGRSLHSSSDLIGEIRSAEIHKGEMQRLKEWSLLQMFRKHANCLGLDFEQFVGAIRTVNITHTSQVQAFDWMPMFPFPREYGFDIGKEITDFGLQYSETQLRFMLGKGFDTIIQAHRLASRVVLDRTWEKLAGTLDSWGELYAFVRSVARISLLAMAIAGKTKYPAFSREISNIYLAYCLLERRIALKDTPIEGIRLIKFS